MGQTGTKLPEDELKVLELGGALNPAKKEREGLVWPTWGSWRGESRGYAALDHDPVIIIQVYTYKHTPVHI